MAKRLEAAKSSARAKNSDFCLQPLHRSNLSRTNYVIMPIYPIPHNSSRTSRREGITLTPAAEQAKQQAELDQHEIVVVMVENKEWYEGWDGWDGCPLQASAQHPLPRGWTYLKSCLAETKGKPGLA